MILEGLREWRIGRVRGTRKDRVGRGPERDRNTKERKEGRTWGNRVRREKERNVCDVGVGGDDEGFCFTD